jgi:GLPGLI family protein
MKILIFLLLYLLTTTSIVFSQNNNSGIINYQSFINKGKLKKNLSDKKNKKLNSLVKMSLDYNNPINSQLKFSNGAGIFLVEDKMVQDESNLGQNMAILRAGGSNEYYYNDKTKTYLIKECEALGECFIFDNTFLEWKLTQETRTINGYQTYKAIRSNGGVIAWYTPNIPISFGPKGEYGLPGLILELEINKIIFKATKIVLNPKEGVKIEEPIEGTRLSKEEYKEAIDKAKRSIFGN